MCDDFCLRYINRLKEKMPSEISLEDNKDSLSESMPTTSGCGNSGDGAGSYATAASASLNPINSSSSSSFTSSSSNDYHTGLPQSSSSTAAAGLHPQLKIENDYNSNGSQLAFNNSTNTANPTYSSLVDCSTPIPNQYAAVAAAAAYHGTSGSLHQHHPHLHLNQMSHHQMSSSLHQTPNYHSLTSAAAIAGGAVYPPQGYMQSFFGQQGVAVAHHLNQSGASLYGPGQYDFGNGENEHLTGGGGGGFHHTSIKSEYGSSGSNKRMLNEHEPKESHQQHTLTLLGSNGASSIITSAGQLGNSGNNSFSNHNLDTNSETGKRE